MFFARLLLILSCLLGYFIQFRLGIILTIVRGTLIWDIFNEVASKIRQQKTAEKYWLGYLRQGATLRLPKEWDLIPLPTIKTSSGSKNFGEGVKKHEI